MNEMFSQVSNPLYTPIKKKLKMSADIPKKWDWAKSPTWLSDSKLLSNLIAQQDHTDFVDQFGCSMLLVNMFSLCAHSQLCRQKQSNTNGLPGVQFSD